MLCKHGHQHRSRESWNSLTLPSPHSPTTQPNSSCKHKGPEAVPGPQKSEDRECARSSPKFCFQVELLTYLFLILFECELGNLERLGQNLSPKGRTEKFFKVPIRTTQLRYGT